MVTSTTSTSVGAASSLITSNATGNTAKSTADAQADRFLKLLVAQLNNQDPMNPMDNAQMTSQMAQINTVTGIQQLNDTIQSIAGQFAAMQVMQGATMIGHDVLTQGNNLPMASGVGKAAYELSGSADNVTVKVMSPGGQLLDTLNLGTMTAGRHDFEWKPSNYTGTGTPTFSVVATQGKSTVSATALNRDTVASVSADSGALVLALKSGGTVKYDAVKAIL
ncbi:MAG: flagellar biosynthesis protein FlgD [Burkholderiales bacterium PBB4]|nr:MAG: flagellar biosynthesis protein FlgD [Burkholderiales bacterium PBB4]